MLYSIKEIFYTLQGEGAQAGRPAVFCRFSGCNLWSGREADRAKSPCGFCDTDFIGTDGVKGGKYENSHLLAESINSCWPQAYPHSKYVVFTGGEPLLQLDKALIDAMHARGFQIGIETNGTIAVPSGIDWICVSPKTGAELKQKSGNELKLIFPQTDQDISVYESLDFDHFYLQPMDGPERERNTRRAIETCLERPKWKLSLQTHKMLNIP